MVKTPEVLRFPDDSGFLFHHIWGKTLRDGSSNVFGLRRHPNQAVCPIADVETYVAISAEFGRVRRVGFNCKALERCYKKTANRSAKKQDSPPLPHCTHRYMTKEQLVGKFQESKHAKRPVQKSKEESLVSRGKISPS